MLCSKILNHSKQKKQSKPFLEFYLKLLKFLLQNKFIYVLIIIPMIFFSYHLYKKISKEFAPQEDRGVFIMVMESPEGSTFENTVNQMLKLEEKLMDLNENNEAKRILLRVPRSFSGTENFSDGLGIIVLNHWDERRKIWEIIKDFRMVSKDVTDSNVIIFPPRGLGQRRSGQQLQFVISGDNYSDINKNMSIILDELKTNKNFLFTRIDYKKIDLNLE